MDDSKEGYGVTTKEAGEARRTSLIGVRWVVRRPVRNRYSNRCTKPVSTLIVWKRDINGSAR